MADRDETRRDALVLAALLVIMAVMVICLVAVWHQVEHIEVLR